MEKSIPLFLVLENKNSHLFRVFSTFIFFCQRVLDHNVEIPLFNLQKRYFEVYLGFLFPEQSRTVTIFKGDKEKTKLETKVSHKQKR